MKKIFILLILLSTIAFAQAAFDVNSTSISEKYSKGDYLRGSLKISFDEHPLGDYFEDSLENKVYLADVLENNPDFEYSCSSEGCETIYGSNTPEKEKTFSLDKNEDALYGFRLVGVIEEISNVSFSVQSDAGQSENNQLKIDILNDGTYDTGNTNVGSQVGSTDYDGCFDDSKTIIERATFESNNPYCQRIEIPESPAINAGAWIEEVTAGNANLSVSFYTSEGTFLDECFLPKESIRSEGSMVYCQIDYLISEKKDYYVCVMSDDGDGKYRTKAYYDDEFGCGFKGAPVQTEVGAYKIAIRPISFAPVGTIEITNELPEYDFSSLLYSYIEEEYGTKDGYLDCSDNCVIPIKFSSYEDQEITLSGLELLHEKRIISGANLEDFYEIDEVGAKITSEEQVLKLNDLFQMPSEEDTFDYSLDLSGEEIYSGEIEITDVSFSLNIRKTASGFPNEFNLTGDLSDITEYNWDFGDNNTAKTTVSSVSHVYEKEGNYTMTISMKDTEGAEFEQSFKIFVSNPKKLIEERLDDFEKRVSMFKSQLSNLDPVARSSVEEIINITKIESQLNYVKATLEVAETQEEYDELISIVLNLDIPSGVFQTSTAKAPFFVSPESIDLDAIVENVGGYVEAGNEDAYKDAIVFWIQNNLHVRVSTKQVLIKEGDETYAIDSVFDVTITPREYFESEYYMYVADWGSIKVSADDTIALEGYKAIPLSSEETTIKISGEDLSLDTLPIFIAPALSDLEIVDTSVEEVEESNNTLLILVLVIIGAAGFGLLIYILLQKWYKVKYEKYLFKDRTNLYNVMVYVNSAKKNGMSNEDIKKNLRKSGWSGEQIRYIMRKYEGKNTGMYELSTGSDDSEKSRGPKRPQQDEKNPVKMSSGLNRTQDLNRFNPRYKL